MRAARVARSIQAPAEKRVAKIIDAIVEEVGDPSVKVFAETLIDYLRAVELQPLTGNRKKNRQYAARLRKQLDAVKETLKKMPKEAPELVSFVFEPEKFGPLYRLEGTPVELVSRLFRAPADVRDSSLAQERLKHLIEEVDRRIARCGHAIAAGIGKRKNEEYPQQRAAIASRAVMEHVGLPLAISENSKYCKVASLFFEAMTGKDVQDLRRACRAVKAQKYRK